MKTCWVLFLRGIMIACWGHALGAADAEEPSAGRTSAHISAAIRAGLPTFKSAPPEEKTPPPAKPPELDIPSEIVSMPKFIVRERTGLSTSSMMTDAGLKQLFNELYPGATVPGLPARTQLVSNYADLMYREDVRLQAKSELLRVSEAAQLSGDKKDAEDLKHEIERTFMRRHDWREDGMDKSINAYRR